MIPTNYLLKKYILKIIENINCMKNLFLDEYINVYSIEMFNELIMNNYNLISMIYDDKLICITLNTFLNILNLIRINMNKINYIIRYILIFQYKKMDQYQLNFNYDIFDTQFLSIGQYFYISNDNNEMQSLLDQLINYKILDEKILLISLIFDMNSIDDNFDINCAIKYIFQLFLKIEINLLRLLANLKCNNFDKINILKCLKKCKSSSSSFLCLHKKNKVNKVNKTNTYHMYLNVKKIFGKLKKKYYLYKEYIEVYKITYLVVLLILILMNLNKTTKYFYSNSLKSTMSLKF